MVLLSCADSVRQGVEKALERQHEVEMCGTIRGWTDVERLQTGPR
jgi:hypothetical protein